MQLPGLTIGIIADDLTGANDTALQFFLAGASVNVLPDFVDPPDFNGAQVWSVNAHSRHLDARDAVAAVRRSVALLRDRFGVENFYKKMDSTLRGHVAQECLAVLDELRADCAVIVPAFPQEGRRTVGGYQLLKGLPVEQTEVAMDPLFPVRISHLPTLLAQTSKPEIVGHIELSTVLHGAGPILKALLDQIQHHKKLVVVDACSPTDLEQIALALEKANKSAHVIPCGSAGLAQALARIWPNEGTPRSAHETFPPTPLLVMAGSNTATTRDQVNRLVENYACYGQGSQVTLLPLSPERLTAWACETTPDFSAVVADILAALGERNTVIVSTAAEEDSLLQTMTLAESHNLSLGQMAAKTQEILAAITRAVLKAREVKLVIAGGETATYICKALGIQALRLVAEAERSIPLMVDLSNRCIVTKSGNFGSPLALANVVKFLKQVESHPSAAHARRLD